MRFFAKIENGLVVETLTTSGSDKNEGGWMEHEYMHVNTGFSYDEDSKCFYPPKPYESFIKNTVHHNWDPPLDYPNDGKEYRWEENELNWIELTSNT